MLCRVGESTLDGELLQVFVSCLLLAVRASNPNHFFAKLKLRVHGIIVIIIPVVHAQED
jgi:hypothetical protein